MHHETTRRIPADHPALAGHFPGHPVVPGVVILDEVLAALRQCEAQPIAMPAVKFLAPLLPEQVFTIRLNSAGADKVKFECLRDETVLAAGSVDIVS